MSCVPCEVKFIIVISTTRYRNSFQCDTMRARPGSPQLCVLRLSQTSDSFTRTRTKSASSAGSPPMKNSGRQPQRGNTKK